MVTAGDASANIIIWVQLEPPPHVDSFVHLAGVTQLRDPAGWGLWPVLTL